MGHIDFARLREGNVSLQVFSVVTKYPLSLSSKRYYPYSNLVRFIRPVWWSLREHAIRQIDRLSCEECWPLLMICESSDLDDLMDQRSKDRKLVRVIKAIEGLHWLPRSADGAQGEIRRLHKLGFRMISP